ncbi:MAG: carboxypeptidase regulatory-like domain-containing protein [Verrucomicrobiales bacterium]|nr:carboxypeptidase regulatory-like domain-containing protein [Verrucomicrobiales bacterium]
MKPPPIGPRRRHPSRSCPLTVLFAVLLAAAPITVTSAELPTFTVRMEGTESAVLTGGSTRHEITVHLSGTLNFRPKAFSCDADRFSGDQVRLTGTVRAWGEAVESKPGREYRLRFDSPTSMDRESSHTILRSTPQTAEHLYLITKDVIYVPPDQVTVYAVEYVSELGVARVWIALPEPFSYAAELEHYDVPAQHSVAVPATTPSCVFGRVTEQGTGVPLAGATVTIGSAVQTADTQGAVAFTGFPPGTYTVTVTARGFAPLQGAMEVAPFAIDHYEFPLGCCAQSSKLEEIDFQDKQGAWESWPTEASPRYTSKAGETLVVWWMASWTAAGHYELRYYGPGERVAAGEGVWIGRCLFNHGMNRAWLSYSDTDRDGTPDCFTKIIWQNFDFAEDDEGPSYCADKFDKYEWEFHPASGTLTQTHSCYDYVPDDCLPPVDEDCWAQIKNRLSCQTITQACWLEPCVHCRDGAPDVSDSQVPACKGRTLAAGKRSDNPVQADFAAQLAAFQAAFTRDQPAVMGRLPHSLLDVDLNGVVDARDMADIGAAFRSGRGDDSYLAVADVDGDLQVDCNDLQVLLPQDSDADGAADWEEVLAGSDPFDTTLRFRLSGLEVLAEGDVLLRWPSIPGRRYRVHRARAETLQEAEVVAADLQATPPVNTFLDSHRPHAATSFYWLEVY